MFYSFVHLLLFAYVLAGLYLTARLYMALAGTGPFRILATLSLFVSSLAFPLGRVLSGHVPGQLPLLLLSWGSLFLAPLLYAVMLTVSVDIIRLIRFAVRVTLRQQPYRKTNPRRVAAAIALLSLFISLAGALNAALPTVKHLAFNLNGGTKKTSLRIAALADLHLDGLFAHRHLERLVNLTLREEPDIVFLLGDQVDSARWLANKEARARCAELLRRIKPRLGVFAVLGNHDHYSGSDESAAFLAESGVKLLRDESVILDDFVVMGREDPTAYPNGYRQRSLRSLKNEALGNRKLPIILLDHQPIYLYEAEAADVALQLSGHTHRGQLFPVNYLISPLFEVHYGEYRKGTTQYYVSSGAGTWGPPVRTSGRPEILIIDVTFDGSDGH